MAKPKMPALQLWVYNRVLAFEVENKHEKIEMVDAWWDFYSKIERFPVLRTDGVDHWYRLLQVSINVLRILISWGPIVASAHEPVCAAESRVTVGILPRDIEQKINQTSGTEMREDTQLCPRDLDAGIRDCQVDVSFVAIDEALGHNRTLGWYGSWACAGQREDEISQSRIIVQCKLVGTQNTAPISPEIERELIWDAADGSNSRDNDLASARVVKRLESSNF
ncbi:hypothetical protein SELMODRAFT_423585 [Selaginella moellendorffii]|uniref:Uncharacterized protein n=1 Tax=Selaginella moellendorffii TaxID=88036 RepID=D8SM62_SELML|nr:hypothetical protein SELMODRAFT_423585 [Selaginella moellendorffii]